VCTDIKNIKRLNSLTSAANEGGSVQLQIVTMAYKLLLLFMVGPCWSSQLLLLKSAEVPDANTVAANMVISIAIIYTRMKVVDAGLADNLELDLLS
jgi:hypothetical protein